MLDFTDALNLLKSGHTIQRPDSHLSSTSYFVKYEDGKQYLFVRQTRLNSPDVVEERTTFDWDDLTATTWEVVETPAK